jgi:hypothetical protein
MKSIYHLQTSEDVCKSLNQTIRTLIFLLLGATTFWTIQRTTYQSTWHILTTKCSDEAKHAENLLPASPSPRYVLGWNQQIQRTELSLTTAQPITVRLCKCVTGRGSLRIWHPKVHIPPRTVSQQARSSPRTTPPSPFFPRASLSFSTPILFQLVRLTRDRRIGQATNQQPTNPREEKHGQTPHTTLVQALVSWCVMLSRMHCS